jgi:hypothetical protein
LQRDQPVSGVQLIVLSEHVDYWNNQGWKDPFSDPQFSERQGEYGSRIYTPQVMVDGRIDVLGSDQPGIERAAKAVALEPHGTVRLARTARGVKVSASELHGHRDARVMLAVVEDGLVSKVERGENAGRTLAHSAVVRSLREVGKVPVGASQWSSEVSVTTDVSWRQTRLVAFVQDAGSRRILASAALQEQRDGAPAERDQRGADDEAHGAKNAHAP